MKVKALIVRITTALALLFAVVFGLIFRASTHESPIQYILLGSLIGFAVPWLIYFSMWFIIKGISRTAFPRQSEQVVNFLVERLGRAVTADQKKLLVEMTGTLMLVCIAFGLVGAAFIVASGLLFIAGRLSW